MTTQLQSSEVFLANMDQFGRRVARRLDASSSDLSYDISERLRAAREQALSRKKAAPVVRVRHAPAVITNGSSALTFGGDFFGWWGRLASAAPLVALVAGLFVIQVVQDENRANELAEVDAALLTDDLPPEAYSDPGFAQFIKTHATEER